MISDPAEVTEPARRKLRAVPDLGAVPPSGHQASVPPGARLVFEDGKIHVSKRPPGLRGPFRPLPVDYVIDGTRLRRQRRRKCMSIVLLAELAGVSRNAIGRLERQSHATCRTGTLIQLCNALAIPPTDLEPAPDPAPAPSQECVAV